MRGYIYLAAGGSEIRISMDVGSDTIFEEMAYSSI